MIKNVLVVLGPPGSGKGTQGKMLAPILKYNYLSMGQYLRQFSEGESELSQQVKQTIDSGRIIRDEWMTQIFPTAIAGLPDADGIILDGFPRDLGQTPILETFLREHQTENFKVLFLEVEKEDLIKRITQRESQGGEMRADDNPEIISTRFEEYKNKTYPLKKYFEDRGVLITVNGNQPIEGTHQEILRKLGL
ncbi:MAG: nucleoside monophosphate kinase [Candidatus Doudnabacteria bacterium]|nr:nucleoside monophosphate kinase [Candidatus Doudnabacteria bacterium]